MLLGWGAPGLSLRLLGPVAIGAEPGAVQPVEQRMLRVLISVLGLAEGRPVSVSELVVALWDEEATPEREKNLHSRVSALRQVLESAEPGRGASRLVRVANGYSLKVDADSTDVAEFRKLSERGMAAARAGDAAAGAALLRTALSLWRGPALADAAPFSSRLATAASALHEAEANAREELTDCDLALGMHSELIAGLTALAEQYPLRERLAGQLMVALWRCGRRGDALAVYIRTQRALADELGLDPGPRLREVQARVLADDPTLAGAAPAVAGARPALPAPLASFVGRQAELAELGTLMARHRLVTITGTGGAGKTRLAIQAAAAHAEDYRDGAWFTDLAELSDPAQVPGAVAAALGIHLVPGEAVLQQVLERSSGMRAVLVMDNCEHLLDSVAATVESVLRRSPGVRVLATSRQPLGLPGECAWQVPPLGFPAAPDLMPPEELSSYDAVRLFTERMPQDRHDAADLRMIARITAILDGLPLAIELAAAPAVRLGLPELLRTLSGRAGTALLRSRTGHRRQQTLEGTISWSYDLLTPGLRAALRPLSVFADGFTLEAAAAVIGVADAAWPVDALAERSLIVVDRDERLSSRHLPARYRMLETIKQYCAARIDAEDGAGEAAALRDRHARYFAGLAAQAAGPLTGRDQGRWLTALESDFANLVSALDHLLSQPEDLVRLEEALRMLVHLDRFWHNRGHLAECVRLAERALAAADGAISPSARSRVLSLTGLAILWHDVKTARGYLDEALRIARGTGDAADTAVALSRLGLAHHYTGQDSTGGALTAEAVLLARETGDLALLGECLMASGLGAAPEEYRAVFAESLGVALHSGDLLHAALARCNLADSYLIEGDMEAALKHLEQALPMLAEVGAAYPMPLINLGWAHLNLGRPDIAHACFVDALRQAERQHMRRHGSFAILGLGCTAAAQGDAPRAARLIGFADMELTECGGAWTAPEAIFRERWLASAERELGPDYRRHYAAGGGASRPDLLDEAFTHFPAPGGQRRAPETPARGLDGGALGCGDDGNTQR